MTPVVKRLRTVLRRRSPDPARIAPAPPKRVAVWRTASSSRHRPTGSGRPGELVLGAADDPSDVHARLAGFGPVDLVVDETGDGPGAVDRFRSSFLGLRRRGVYLVPRAHAAAVEAVASFLARADLAPELAGAVREVRRSADGLEVERTGRTLAKLREPEMNLALATDPARGRILATVPGVEFDSLCVRRVSRPRRKDATRPRYEAPDLFLREYLNVVCRPKSVVVQRGLLTPDTFRHHQQKRLQHMQLRDAGALFAVAPPGRRVERLPGAYFHLDNEHRGYFGHALTEQVSRLWAWPQAKEQFPDLRVLVSLNRGRPLAEWEVVLLEAAGIDRRAVEVAERPVRVDRLVAATPMLSMPNYVHPRITETWDAIGATMLSLAERRARPRRIFCSRRHEKRPCLNRHDVEKLFSSYGFEVVFPEDHPLPEQVAMFHDAEVVAGFAGSGLFTAMFTDRPKHLVVIAPDTYGPTNEYLIASVRGHRLDEVVGTTPKVLPEGVPGVRADRPLSWPFSLDMATDGEWLREILAGLED